MTNKFVEEAPYHPGYEDAAFKDGVSPLLQKLINLERAILVI